MPTNHDLRYAALLSDPYSLLICFSHDLIPFIFSHRFEQNCNPINMTDEMTFVIFVLIGIWCQQNSTRKLVVKSVEMILGVACNLERNSLEILTSNYQSHYSSHYQAPMMNNLSVNYDFK